MKLRLITKLYFLITLFSLSFLYACVNNGDEPDVPTIKPRESVVLNNRNLAGTWEVYYFEKQIVDDRTQTKTKYRFTEQDGFTVTLTEDGKYEEKNVFGGTTIKGTYKVGRKSDASKKDDLLIITPDEDYIKDNETVIYSEIPNLYEESFITYMSYQGNSENGGYRVADTRYYRNKKNSDFMEEGLPKRLELTQEELMGGWWEFYHYYLRIAQNSYETELGKEKPGESSILDPIKKALGELYYFNIENDSLIFRQVNVGEDEINMRGMFLINDDVINMKWEGQMALLDKDGNLTGEVVDTIVSMKWWITDKTTTNGGMPVLKDFDRYRDYQNLLKDTEERASYRQYKDKSSKVRSVLSKDDVLKMGVKKVATKYVE